MNEKFNSIDDYVEYYKPMGSLREIIKNCALPKDDEECKKTIEKMIKIYFQDDRN